MTLRLRLTLITAILIAVATAALGITVYIATERTRMATIDENLYAEISEARVRTLELDPRPPQPGVVVDTALGKLERDGISVRPLRSAGTSDNPIALPTLNSEQLADAIDGPITLAGSPDFRVAVRSHGPGKATVIAATPLTDLQQALASLARIITLAGIVVVILGGLVAWLVVRRAFVPMDAMVVAAGAIASGETQRRLAPARRGTEIGDLSESINAMIESLAAAVTRAEQSEARLRTFLSDASHEIRTPLTVIRGYAELLVRQEVVQDEAHVRALHRIESESQRLDRLVTSLLNLQRSTAPRRGPVSNVVLDELVYEAVEDLRVLDPTREVSARVERADVLADPDALREVLSNIVQNLVRHTPMGSSVYFALRVDGRYCVLTVDDSGSGMEPARRAAIAEGAYGSTSEQGFGLGMAIMQAIVTQNSGTLGLLESPYGGLRLEVQLPLAPS